MWFSPFPCELTTDRAVRRCSRTAPTGPSTCAASGARVVLVTGCELSLFDPGFLPGGNSYERITRLAARARGMYASFARCRRLNGFLAETADAVRGAGSAAR